MAAAQDLQAANAEIARLRRKVLRYRDEIVNLREKLEEPAYNEPESELERLEEEVREAREPDLVPPSPPPPPVVPSGYLSKLRHRFRGEFRFVPLPWPPHPLLLLFSFIGSFAGTLVLQPSNLLGSARLQALDVSWPRPSLCCCAHRTFRRPFYDRASEVSFLLASSPSLKPLGPHESHRSLVLSRMIALVARLAR